MSLKMLYYVYVIRLDDTVLKSHKFLRQNPDLNTRFPCYYVGQSAHDPETRFWQHKKGYKSNYFAQEFGLGLCPQYYNHINPISSRKEAEEIESKLTKQLRDRGCGVWSH